MPGSQSCWRHLLSSALQACSSTPSHPTHSVHMLTFRETGCPVQLWCVLFLSLYLCGLQTHVSPAAFDCLPHLYCPLFPAVALGCVATMVTLVTAWCSKGAQGSPPGRCPARCPPGYTDLVFVDLENVGGSCKPSPIAPREPFSPHPCWYGTAPTLGPVSPPFSSVPTFLIVALHFPLAAGLQREVSQLATTCARHHHPPQARDTGAFTPGRAPTLPWAEFLVALGTAAWPQEQGYCTTSAEGCCFLHLTAPPNCNTSDLCCSTFA